MPKPTPCILVLAALWLFVGTLQAHGGQYRGPRTGGAAGNGPRGALGPRTGGAGNLDINSWQVWWQLNHERYLDAPTTTVTDGDRRSIVMPTLALALGRNDVPHILSASLIALGKSAVDTPEIDVLGVLRKHLSNSTSEVREAATLALGLTGRTDAVADLSGLLTDNKLGRRPVSRSKVNDRVRAFAAYALGILAQRTDSVDARAMALAALISVLERKSNKDPEVLTAVLHGIRILGATKKIGADNKLILETAIAALEAHLKRKLKGKFAVAQSNGLTALAYLARHTGAAEQARAVELITNVLRNRRAESSIHVSTMIAAGQLFRPNHTRELAILLKHVTKPSDSLVPKFAMIALGQIGGDTAFEVLRDTFKVGSRDIKPWAALGLGLLGGERKVPGGIANQPQAANRNWRNKAGEVLLAGLKSEKSRNLRGAIAIALGLAKVQSAAKQLSTIASNRADINARLTRVGLAMLDKNVSARQAMAAVGGTGYASKPQSIGHTKDAYYLPGLSKTIGAAKKTRTGRANPSTIDYQAAFAAAAMGAIADSQLLSFGTYVAEGMNYTTRIPTVINGQTGILDIF